MARRLLRRMRECVFARAGRLSPVRVCAILFFARAPTGNPSLTRFARGLILNFTACFKIRGAGGGVRRTRFMNWFFLVLGLAFFALPDFRRALEAPLAGLYFAQPAKFPGLARFFTLKRYASDEELLELARAADERGDSDLTAFAALNLPTGTAWSEVGRLADHAVAHDPSLTWIYVPLLYRYKQAWDWVSASQQSAQYMQFIQERITKLEAFDPTNAVPHLMRAELIRAGHGWNWPPGAFNSPEHLDDLASEKAWRKEMEAAFRSEHYDSYQLRRFDLNRRILAARGWGHPLVMVSLLVSATAPDFYDMREYANLLVLRLGPEAEAAHRMNRALDEYWEVAQFGRRVELSSSTDLERTLGTAIEQIGERGLVPALARAHRQEEADMAGFLGAEHIREVRRARSPLARTTNRAWSIFLVNLSACLVVVFLLASLVSFLYVNLRRRPREGSEGLLRRFLTPAGNYSPIALFASCAALYFTYIPYAQNFAHVMTVRGTLEWIPASLIENIYPLPGVRGLSEGLPLQNPFRPYVLAALAGLAAVVATALVLDLIRRHKKPGWR